MTDPSGVIIDGGIPRDQKERVAKLLEYLDGIKGDRELPEALQEGDSSPDCLDEAETEALDLIGEWLPLGYELAVGEPDPGDVVVRRNWNTCPHCGNQGEFWAEYYDCSRQTVTFSDDGSYTYAGVVDSLDSVTEDECVRCASCLQEVIFFGNHVLLSPGAARVLARALRDWGKAVPGRTLTSDYTEALLAVGEPIEEA